MYTPASSKFAISRANTKKCTRFAIETAVQMKILTTLDLKNKCGPEPIQSFGEVFILLHNVAYEISISCN